MVFLFNLLHRYHIRGQSLYSQFCWKGIAYWWFFDMAFFMSIFYYNRPRMKNRFVIRIIRSGWGVSWIMITLYHLLPFFMTRWLYLFFPRIDSRPRTPLKVLITSEDVEWKATFNPATGEEKKTDTFFQELVKIVQKNNGLVLATYPLLSYPYRNLVKKIHTIKEKRKSGMFQYVPFEYYFTISSIYEAVSVLQRSQEIADLVNRSKEIHKYCCFDKQDFTHLIREALTKYLIAWMPRTTVALATARNLLDIEKPNVLVIEEEYGLFERALIIAAKERNIPTIGVQHGLIYPDHKAYRYSLNDITPLKDDPSWPGVSIPDVMAVYGPADKSCLEENAHFPSSMIRVIGNLKYDLFSGKDLNKMRLHILEELHIPPAAPIVLWATQQADNTLEENSKNIDCVMEAVREYSGLYLLIKQHPSEQDNHTRLLIHSLERTGVRGQVLPKSVDIIPYIHISSVVITHQSTVGLDVIVAGRPLIILNLFGTPDNVDYVNRKVAYGVYHTCDLPILLDGILTKNQSLEANYEEYLKDKFFRLDGKASSRLFSIITELQKNHKSPGAHEH